MNDASALHKEAMKLADEAFVARTAGDHETAMGLIRRAFDHERRAAQVFSHRRDAEPTRSVLHRSAATLALECGELDATRDLITSAFEGNPAPEIAEELREVMRRVYARVAREVGGVHDPSESSVTVVVPCYNEEAGLPILLYRLREAYARGLFAGWRFLFVDDGSSDGTFSSLLRAAQEYEWMAIVRHPENSGLGAALRTGFDHARSPIVCTMDSDCHFPPERLPDLVMALRRGAHIVTASAVEGTSPVAASGTVRRRMHRFVSAAYSFLIGQDVYTFNTMFRAYRKAMLERLEFRSSGFAAISEIMLRAMLAGYTVREVGIRPEHSRAAREERPFIESLFKDRRLFVRTTFVMGRRRILRAFGARS